MNKTEQNLGNLVFLNFKQTKSYFVFYNIDPIVGFTVIDLTCHMGFHKGAEETLN